MATERPLLVVQLLAVTGGPHGAPGSAAAGLDQYEGGRVCQGNMISQESERARMHTHTQPWRRIGPEAGLADDGHMKLLYKQDGRPNGPACMVPAIASGNRGPLSFQPARASHGSCGGTSSLVSACRLYGMVFINHSARMQELGLHIIV